MSVHLTSCHLYRLMSVDISLLPVSLSGYVSSCQFVSLLLPVSYVTSRQFVSLCYSLSVCMLLPASLSVYVTFCQVVTSFQFVSLSVYGTSCQAMLLLEFFSLCYFLSGYVTFSQFVRLC
jgi:hypothetical protein